jgi:hypothetical protein
MIRPRHDPAVSPTTRAAARRTLMSVRELTKTFPTRDGAELPMLEGIDLDCLEGRVGALAVMIRTSPAGGRKTYAST